MRNGAIPSDKGLLPMPSTTHTMSASDGQGLVSSIKPVVLTFGSDSTKVNDLPSATALTPSVSQPSAGSASATATPLQSSSSASEPMMSQSSLLRNQNASSSNKLNEVRNRSLGAILH